VKNNTFSWIPIDAPARIEEWTVFKEIPVQQGTTYAMALSAGGAGPRKAARRTPAWLVYTINGTYCIREPVIHDERIFLEDLPLLLTFGKYRVIKLVREEQ
jgi:hypothetical protein